MLQDKDFADRLCFEIRNLVITSIFHGRMGFFAIDDVKAAIFEVMLQSSMEQNR